MALTEKQITDAVAAKHKGREVESVVINPGRVSAYLKPEKDGDAPQRVVYPLADLKAPRRGTKASGDGTENPEA